MTSSSIATPATIVGARSGCSPVTRTALGVGHAREPVEDARADRAPQDVAVHERAVVGIQAELDRGARRRGAGDGDGHVATLRRSLGRDVVADDLRDLAAQAVDLVGARRIVIDVTLGLAHDAGLRRDVEVDGALAPVTNSVEPPPMSTTSTSSPVSARSLVAPAKVSAASSSPPIVRASRS